MSTPGAGHEFAPVDVSWLKRDVLLFAASIGCTVDELHFLYVRSRCSIRALHTHGSSHPSAHLVSGLTHPEVTNTPQQELHPQFTPFPTYPILLPFKTTNTEVTDFYAATSTSQKLPAIPNLPKLDPRRIVDGQRRMTFHAPIPPTSSGRKFQIRSKVLGVYDKGKPGTVMETEQRLVDAESGECFTTVVGSAFYVGQGGWGGPKGEKAPEYPVPSKERAPDAVATTQTTAETAHLYRLNGDYNPLHATPEPGAKMGFGGAIMHGLYSWNTSAHALLKAFGGSKAENLKSYEARFASPVKPGGRLVTEMWRMGAVEGGQEIRFTVRVEGGKVCLSNGRAVVKVVEGEIKSKL